MKKTGKLLLLFVTLYPIVYLIYFITAIMNMMMTLDDPASVGGVFPMLFMMHLIAMVGVIALITFYIVHAVRNRALANETRIIWVLLIFLGNMIAMPIYWYLYIWKPQEKKETYMKPMRN